MAKVCFNRAWKSLAVIQNPTRFLPLYVFDVSGVSGVNVRITTVNVLIELRTYIRTIFMRYVYKSAQCMCGVVLAVYAQCKPHKAGEIKCIVD